MTVALPIPSEYGYVLLAASSSFVVNIWHATQTSKARKASGIGYPNAYATAEQAAKDPAAYNLNCAQRAHANFTENLTPWVIVLLTAGLRYPLPAAGLGFGWLVSRVVYAAGYTSQGPKGRLAGSLGHYLSMLGLVGLAGYTGFQIAMGK